MDYHSQSKAQLDSTLWTIRQGNGHLTLAFTLSRFEKTQQLQCILIGTLILVRWKLRGAVELYTARAEPEFAARRVG